MSKLLYKLALKYIKKYKANFDDKRWFSKRLTDQDRLTYRSNMKAYLKYGLESEWETLIDIS